MWNYVFFSVNKLISISQLYYALSPFNYLQLSTAYFNASVAQINKNLSFTYWTTKNVQIVQESAGANMAANTASHMRR